MADKANNKVNKTQEFTVELTSIRVYGSEEYIRYRVGLNQTIPAIVRNPETDEYEAGEVDYIDFVPAVLIAQCLDRIQGLDLMFTKKKEQALKAGNASGFGAAELSVVLRGAKIRLVRNKFETGDEYTTTSGEVRTHEHEGYNTDIADIKVSSRVQDKLDDMLDKVFDI